MAPERPHEPTVSALLNDLLRRMRATERHRHPLQDFEFDENSPFLRAYSWQSAFNLTTGFGHKLFADRAGTIQFIRAERSSGDGVSTATFDVLLNGTSLFVTNSGPTVLASTALGEEAFPDTKGFDKGDNFQVEILTTGGGTGPLRVTIHFVG